MCISRILISLPFNFLWFLFFPFSVLNVLYSEGHNKLFRCFCAFGPGWCNGIMLLHPSPTLLIGEESLNNSGWSSCLCYRFGGAPPPYNVDGQNQYFILTSHPCLKHLDKKFWKRFYFQNISREMYFLQYANI